MSETPLPVEGTQEGAAQEIVKGIDLELSNNDINEIFNVDPTPEIPMDADVSDFIKQHVPQESSGTKDSAEALANEPVLAPEQPKETEPAPAIEQSADLASEVANLKRTLGEQGSTQGDLVKRAEQAEAELMRIRESAQQAPPAAPVTGRDVARQLDPSFTDADFEDPGMASLYDRMGTMQQAAATEIFGQVQAALQQLTDRLDAGERRGAESAAEAKLGSIPADVKQKLEKERPGLLDIKDPEERVAMMRTLALAQGLLSDKTAPAAVRRPGRDPSTHVSSGGQSAPSYAPSTASAHDALLDSINRATNATELDKSSKILQASWDGTIDLGADLFGSP